MHAAKPCHLPSIKSLLVEMSHDRISCFPARHYPKIRPLDLLLSPGDQFSSYRVVDKESTNMLPRLPSLASTVGLTTMHPGSSNIHSLLSPPESPDMIKPETSFEEHETQCPKSHHHHEYKMPPTIHPSLSTPSMIYQISSYSTHPQQGEHGYLQSRDCDSHSTSRNIPQPAFTPFEHRSTSSSAPTTSLSHLEIPQGASRHEQVLPIGGSGVMSPTSPSNNNNNSNDNDNNNNSNGNNNNSNRYQCPYCTKRFSRPSSLRIHTYSHTGEKPFVCTEPGCGRKFSVQSNMRRHLRVHRLGRPVKKVRYDGEVEGVKMMNPGIHMRN